jgi:hypothetical protein
MVTINARISAIASMLRVLSPYNSTHEVSSHLSAQGGIHHSWLSCASLCNASNYIDKQPDKQPFCTG